MSHAAGFVGRERQVFCIIIVFLFLASVDSFAALTLSLNPIEGGTSIRFGKFDLSQLSNKEVRVRINSSNGTQYQLVQRLIEPLVNEQGIPLGHNALAAYTLTGSNTAGSLYLQDKESMGLGEQLIYTSNPNGDSDSITVIYVINPVKASGSFFGKIQYTVREINGAGREDAFLNIYLDVENNLSVTSEASHGKNLVRLEPEWSSGHEGFVRFHISGNTDQELKVYQDIIEFPRDDFNEEASVGIVQFGVSGGRSNTSFVPGPVNLEHKRILLYSTSESEDSFTQTFLVNSAAFAEQKAGIYRGKIRYMVESSLGEQLMDLDLELAVRPAFKLDVQYPPGGMRFQGLHSAQVPQFKEVRVAVQSNLGKPYIVTQNIAGPLTNEKGVQIPQGLLIMKQDMANHKPGNVPFSEFREAPLGESPIFYSDNKGSSSEFMVIYQLGGSPEMEAGDYSTAIVYSLGEK